MKYSKFCQYFKNQSTYNNLEIALSIIGVVGFFVMLGFIIIDNRELSEDWARLLICFSFLLLPAAPSIITFASKYSKFVDFWDFDEGIRFKVWSRILWSVMTTAVFPFIFLIIIFISAEWLKIPLEPTDLSIRWIFVVYFLLLFAFVALRSYYLRHDRYRGIHCLRTMLNCVCAVGLMILLSMSLSSQWLHIDKDWLFVSILLVVIPTVSVFITELAVQMILLILSRISYPFRRAKIKRLIKIGKCFTVETAGTILGCRVFNGNTEGLNLRHDWDGCKCKRCGVAREHDWDVCVCRRCGQTRDVPEEQHDWDVCVCKRCGKTRNVPEEQHDWDGCVCRRCGKRRYVPDEQHDWDGCVCRRCGTELHDWKFVGTEDIGDGYGTFDIYKCTRCGEEEIR